MALYLGSRVSVTNTLRLCATFPRALLVSTTSCICLISLVISSHALCLHSPFVFVLSHIEQPEKVCLSDIIVVEMLVVGEGDGSGLRGGVFSCEVCRQFLLRVGRGICCVSRSGLRPLSGWVRRWGLQ